MELKEKTETALRQRTIEMFGLPGDRCPDPVCRRRGRCRSTAPEPRCLVLLDADARKFYKRVLDHCRWAEGNKLSFLHYYIQGLDDPFLALVGEIARRIQPRGHWLHKSLSDWYKMGDPKARRPPVSVKAAAAFPARYY